MGGVLAKELSWRAALKYFPVSPFSVSLYIPKVVAKIKACKIGCFPLKGNPTGLVSWLNLSRVIIRGDVD